MHLIDKLFGKALEELTEAECYAEMATSLKATKEGIASKLYRISEEEITQADTIIGITKELYEDKTKNNLISERDKMRYEVKLELYQEERTRIRIIQAAYKM